MKTFAILAHISNLDKENKPCDWIEILSDPSKKLYGPIAQL